MLRTSSFLILLFVVCCQNKTTNRVELARVFDHYLYLDEVPMIPNSVDSIMFTYNYIDQWATQKLLIQKAELNLDPRKERVSITVIEDLPSIPARAGLTKILLSEARKISTYSWEYEK